MAGDEAAGGRCTEELPRTADDHPPRRGAAPLLGAHRSKLPFGSWCDYRRASCAGAEDRCRRDARRAASHSRSDRGLRRERARRLIKAHRLRGRQERGWRCARRPAAAPSNAQLVPRLPRAHDALKRRRRGVPRAQPATRARLEHARSARAVEQSRARVGVGGGGNKGDARLDRGGARAAHKRVAPRALLFGPRARAQHAQPLARLVRPDHRLEPHGRGTPRLEQRAPDEPLQSPRRRRAPRVPRALARLRVGESGTGCGVTRECEVNANPAEGFSSSPLAPPHANDISKVSGCL